MRNAHGVAAEAGGPAAEPALEHGDPPDLSRDCHATALATAPHELVPAQGGVGRGRCARKDQKGANHGASPALPSLAMHGDDVLRVCSQPLRHIPAKAKKCREGWRTVVRTRKPYRGIRETIGRMLLLAAQVVYPELLPVRPCQEACDFATGVPVGGRGPTAGKAHGNDARGDVREVQVKAVPSVAVPPACALPPQGREWAALEPARGHARLRIWLSATPTLHQAWAQTRRFG
mmetsp:Transcript_96072/g.266925  ORF Transcript_96072/g.266925 Transcript_96072/m.266925 type:complete len:233 (+) Transcript_96072:653-1351(+)